MFIVCQLLEQDLGALIVELIVFKVQVRDAKNICINNDFVKVRLKFCSSYVSYFLMMPALLPCRFKLLTRFGRFLLFCTQKYTSLTPVSQWLLIDCSARRVILDSYRVHWRDQLPIFVRTCLQLRSGRH